MNTGDANIDDIIDDVNGGTDDVNTGDANIDDIIDDVNGGTDDDMNINDMYIDDVNDGTNGDVIDGTNGDVIDGTVGIGINDDIAEDDDDDQDSIGFTTDIPIPDPESFSNIARIEEILANNDSLTYNDQSNDSTYPNGCGQVIPISKLRMETFRTRLVKHYTICQMLRLISWNEIVKDVN